MGVIKEYEDGSYLEYAKGNFDKWCVYYINDKGDRTAPKDTDCFKELYRLAGKYGKDKVYFDYVKVYDSTKKEVEEIVLKQIEQIANEYEQEDILKVDKLFTILYMAMISEERKEKTKLGKKIKRLGIHTLLIENKNIQEAANFMRGKGWEEIYNLCAERGF